MRKIYIAALFGLACAAASSADFFIDRYGQFADMDFPGKVKSDKELQADVEADKKYYGSFKPEKRTFWGSIPGSKEKYGLKATGFFHLEKVKALNNRTVLVDPEGNLHFHLGVCSSMPGNEFTFVFKRESTYEWLPTAQDPKFKSARWGHCASFYIANWIRKHGSYNEAEWQKQIVDRLRQMGFNGYGEFTQVFPGNDKLGFAFTKCLEHYWRQEKFTLVTERFVDPFDPNTAGLLEKVFARRTKPFLKNPALIGYYTENEVEYPKLMRALLEKREPIAAKKEFAAFMKKRYNNDIARFNKNWHGSFGKFEDLHTAALKRQTKEAKADAVAFEAHFFDALYKQLSTALKKVDPDHLYLGERVLPNMIRYDVVIAAMGKYVDAFSANYYCDGYLPAEVTHMVKVSGKPVMLSEWNFGSREQGLFGVRDVKDQKTRGSHYRRYIENAAATPDVIGAQWFCLIDESNTGRGWTNYRGERFNTGLFNICDRPFKQLTDAAYIANNNVYSIIEGKKKAIAPHRYKRLSEGWRNVEVKKISNAKLDCNQEKYGAKSREPLHTSVLTGKFTKNGWGNLRFGWDDNNFYVYVRMPDKTPCSNSGSKAINQDDCVEIMLGGNHDIPGRMLPSDRHLLVRVNKSKNAAFEWRFMGKKIKSEYKPQVFSRSTADGKYFETEIAIPWKAVKIDPAKEKRIRFDVTVSSGEYGKLKERLVYNGTKDSYMRRDYWAVGNLK